MGTDARWVCHTCKTVCSRGGSPLTKGIHTRRQVDDAKDLLFRVEAVFDIGNIVEDVTPFLDDLRMWLFRHEDHNITVGSDYATDFMDLDDYRNESVSGKVSGCTRLEAQTKSMNEWEQTAINEIKRIIRRYTDDTDVGVINRLDSVAAELHNKFSAKEI